MPPGFEDSPAGRRRAVIDNSHIVDSFFGTRVDASTSALFDGVLKAKWKWYRHEYQGSGSIHTYGCVKLDNDPGLVERNAVAYAGVLTKRKLLHWRANVDFQLISDWDQAVRYMAKYVGKGEKRTKPLLDIFRGVMSAPNDDADEPATKRLSVFLRAAGARDLLVQETCSKVLGGNFVSSSFSFVRVDVTMDAGRQVLLGGQRRVVGRSMLVRTQPERRWPKPSPTLWNSALSSFVSSTTSAGTDSSRGIPTTTRWLC